MISHPHALEPRRLYAAGDPLDSFGRHGRALTPYELYTADLGVVKPTPAGKLLAGVADQLFRKTQPGVTADFVQFNADGSPDASFGTDGHADSFFTTVRQIAVRSDGKFYALGSDLDFTAGHGGYSDDRLDRSNGTRDRVRVDLDPTMKQVGTSSGPKPAGFRVDAGGALDPRFDGGSGGDALTGTGKATQSFDNAAESDWIPSPFSSENPS